MGKGTNHLPGARRWRRAWAAAGLAIVCSALSLTVPDAAHAAARADLCAQVSYAADFRDAPLVTAVAVALAESSCNPGAEGDNGWIGTCRSIDRGLFQINSCWHNEVDDDCAYRAQCNADAAYRISSEGADWTPWTTFKTGRYRDFIPEAQAAVDRLPTTPSLPRRPICHPVSGDWDGDGDVTLGVACKEGHGYRWDLMNFHGGGSPQIVGGYGNSDTCRPLVGDWDGDGQDTIGVSCKDGIGMRWSLVNGFQGSPSYPVFGFGNSNVCRPVTGDWNGNGTDTIGIACKEGHGLSWGLMNFHGGGSPQIEAGFGNGDTYQPTGGWGGPAWPAWPTV